MHTSCAPALTVTTSRRSGAPASGSCRGARLAHMSEQQPTPCGSCPPPITASLVIDQASKLGTVALDGDVVYWSELRPHEGGRVQIVRLEPGSEPTDVLPADANARTAVHEYGGGAWGVGERTGWDSQLGEQGRSAE